MRNNNKNDNDKKKNTGRRVVALAMAGLLVVGVLAGFDAWKTVGTVLAQEDKSKDVALNIADREETDKGVELNIESQTEETAKETEAETDAQTEAVTEAETEAQTEAVTEAETEEIQKETFADIERVKSDGVAIVATDVSDIVESCMPSIVSITEKSVEEVETYFYGTQEYEAIGSASGIIVAQNDEELLIATNSHVVDGATELTVGLTAEADDPEDLVVPARIKGMDKDYELAVVAVRLSDIKEEVRDQLKIAQLGSSEKLKVGEAAIAIGNALGYGQSVTSGIISALNREVTIDNFSKKLIMTDASINYGNSGGALLNSEGQVIGINVAKEVSDAAEGMGYSIPIDTAIPVLQNLVNKETRDKKSDSERGYLGITVVDVSKDAKELYNIPAGAFVYEVTEDSVGEAAGIHKGDVITKLDGESVTSKDDLVDKLSYYSVGETVTLEVQTANGGAYESREVEVTLQKGAPLPEQQTEAKKDDAQKDQSNDGQESQDDQQEKQTENDFWFDGFGFPGVQDGDGSFFPFDDNGNRTF